MSEVIDVRYVEMYPVVDAVEEDSGEYNHLFSVRYDYGKNLLISWSGPKQLGTAGGRVWVHVYGLHCEAVATTEPYYNRYVSAKIWLCDAEFITN